MVFLPRTDYGAQERCRVIVEREILKVGYTIYGWRQVPVNMDVVGEKANMTRPEIEQVMISNSRGASARINSIATSTSFAGASKRWFTKRHCKAFTSARCRADR